MPNSRKLLLISCMISIILVSNILVQYPVMIWGLENLLTWAAFTYPVAFFITDITNRIYGVITARKIVFWGFFTAVILSFYFATPRIAIASGSAFLISQLMDIQIFTKLSNYQWWKAPLASSSLGSIIDTLLFFTIAFSLTFSFMGYEDSFATESIIILSGSLEVPRWLMWAFGDFAVKLLVAFILLLPFRLIYFTYQNKSKA
ncbi:MAG: hypothetical protein CBB88_07655 [Rhizobiales bacterium TMED28]|nr:hypothetical protein [Rhodobiaceae bacterium]OUT81268.1 MAG: hypothetical protein CBB88_07655 [Rhizobiales bacterium TMED28]|tara:strand:- start:1019 stop:1627 length:609 start_codon:yes stop_codon:yes gene_type:complete